MDQDPLMEVLKDPIDVFEHLIDLIYGMAGQLRSDGQYPDDLVRIDRARKHLRKANGQLWGVINDLEQILFEAQHDDMEAIAMIAQTHGEPFAGRLRKLIDDGIVELRADRERLRKMEGRNR